MRLKGLADKSLILAGKFPFMAEKTFILADNTKELAELLFPNQQRFRFSCWLVLF